MIKLIYRQVGNVDWHKEVSHIRGTSINSQLYLFRVYFLKINMQRVKAKHEFVKVELKGSYPGDPIPSVS